MKNTGLFVIIALLAACGSQPTKPKVDHRQMLMTALVTKDTNKIKLHKNQVKMSVKDNNIVNLYLSMLNHKPYQLISNSQQLIKNFPQHSPAQQQVLRPMILWAYSHPIYRQETAKQVRLLQRESLLVAPSNIDFGACAAKQDGCAGNLRSQIKNIVATDDLTQTLTSMANLDPCINLTDENLSGEHGNQCLASRKGSLKIKLLEPAALTQAHWQALLIKP